MKRIVKNPEPTAFANWKTNWSHTPGWDEFDQGTKQADGTSIKEKVKAALIEEQGGICCFCEKKFKRDHGHIDHLRAKSKPENLGLVLAYNNLLYSCPENPKGKPQTCGHAQGEETPPITPLDADCELRFIYSVSGAILPRSRNDDEAIQTIALLNLNDEQAVFYGKRAEAYKEIMEKQKTLPPEVFKHWITNMLKRQPDGTFKEFWTTRKYAAGLYS